MRQSLMDMLLMLLGAVIALYSQHAGRTGTLTLPKFENPFKREPAKHEEKLAPPTRGM
jgi:hypothetical protein